MRWLLRQEITPDRSTVRVADGRARTARERLPERSLDAVVWREHRLIKRKLVSRKPVSKFGPFGPELVNIQIVMRRAHTLTAVTSVSQTGVGEMEQAIEVAKRAASKLP